MGSLSPTHWIIVLIVAAILFFGWKQLPDMARSAGEVAAHLQDRDEGPGRRRQGPGGAQAEQAGRSPDAAAGRAARRRLQPTQPHPGCSRRRPTTRPRVPSERSERVGAH